MFGVDVTTWGRLTFEEMFFADRTEDDRAELRQAFHANDTYFLGRIEAITKKVGGHEDTIIILIKKITTMQTTLEAIKGEGEPFDSCAMEKCAAATLKECFGEEKGSHGRRKG